MDLERRDRRLASSLDLTRSQADTLQTLRDLGETAMNGLSEAMRVHGTTMTRMVDTMVERGMVERVPDPQDRRVVRVRLSARGEDVVASLRRSKRELMGATLRELPEAELRDMLEGLRRLALLAQQWGEAGSAPPSPRERALWQVHGVRAMKARPPS